MSAKKNLLWFGAVFILVLSVITFVFIPTVGGVSGNTTPVFGKWDGTPIEYAQDTFFVRQIQNLSEQMQNQGQEVNQFTYYQVMQSAFNSAVVRLGILQELEFAGYVIPDTLVNKSLVNYYLDSSGKYSSTLFEQTPENIRASRRSTLQEELTAQRYISDIFGKQSGLFGLKTSGKETDFIKTMASPERSFSYIALSTDSYPDSEAAKYGAANSQKFVKYALSAIMTDSEATAKKAASGIAKNEITFEDAVTTYSNRSGTDASGILTRSFAYDLQTLFTESSDLETITTLEPGSISPIVKAGNNFAIVRCDKAASQPDFSDSSVLAAVKTYMKTSEAGIIQDYYMAQGASFAEQARISGFDSAASANRLEKKTTASFAVNYGNSDILSPVPVETNTELSGAVNSENFFTAAFSLEPGAVSDPLLVGSYVIVLQLLEEKAADQQTLEMMPLFYNYYANSWSQDALSSAFLESDKLEDNFMQTYLKYFLN